MSRNLNFAQQNLFIYLVTVPFTNRSFNICFLGAWPLNGGEDGGDIALNYKPLKPCLISNVNYQLHRLPSIRILRRSHKKQLGLLIKKKITASVQFKVRDTENTLVKWAFFLSY